MGSATEIVSTDYRPVVEPLSLSKKRGSKEAMDIEDFIAVKGRH
jgi:hypothetical protein